MKKFVFMFVILFVPIFVHAAAPSLNVLPENLIQGEPVIVRIEGLSDITQVIAVMFGKQALQPFLLGGTVAALYGVDLNMKAGEYVVAVNLIDGTKLEKKVIVLGRKKYEAPLGIPQKLGGNSTTSQTVLVNTLAIENAQLAALATGKKAFWTLFFQYPVKDPFVTDEYGYTRTTGQYSITHKGVDLRASSTTRVSSINRGVVRLVKTFRNYGKTIVVDHGLGVMSFYMHLSKVLVNQGELVLPGQLIGYAGQTGYAEKPHLHLTVRINGVSIDPIIFIKLLGR
jgi:murein DD-endopeptidase MepM/ murein hydrolase activator NlpD